MQSRMTESAATDKDREPEYALMLGPGNTPSLLSGEAPCSRASENGTDTQVPGATSSFAPLFLACSDMGHQLV